MATDAVNDLPLTVLPPEMYPDVDHLVTEDDTPVDSIFHEKQEPKGQGARSSASAKAFFIAATTSFRAWSRGNAPRSGRNGSAATGPS